MSLTGLSIGHSVILQFYPEIYNENVLLRNYIQFMFAGIQQVQSLPYIAEPYSFREIVRSFPGGPAVDQFYHQPVVFPICVDADPGLLQHPAGTVFETILH
jgi:hypothetical protein